MDRLRLRSQAGFTAMELLGILGIIGLLAAIATPQVSAHRKKADEAQVKSDLRNAAIAEEAYFTQSLAYKTGSLSSGSLTGYKQSAQVSMIAAAGTNTYLLTATHALCPGVNWTYDSITGAISGPAAGCP